jgi:hypothetical protein
MAETETSADPQPVHCITQIESVTNHRRSLPSGEESIRPIHTHKNYVNLEHPAMLLDPTSSDLSLLASNQQPIAEDDIGEMRSISVQRPILTQHAFDQLHEPGETKRITIRGLYHSLVGKLEKCTRKEVKKKLKKLVPVVDAIRSYDVKQWLFVDIICGLT